MKDRGAKSEQQRERDEQTAREGRRSRILTVHRKGLEPSDPRHTKACDKMGLRNEVAGLYLEAKEDGGGGYS